MSGLVHCGLGKQEKRPERKKRKANGLENTEESYLA